MRARYMTARRVAVLGAALSDRDRQVLATLSRVRVATALQLQHLHFADVSARQARHVLASLTERGLLARLRRVVGGVRAGSAGYVYTLGPAGVRLAAESGRRPQKPWELGALFLAHSLAVTQLYAQLVSASRAGRFALLDFAAEPACWRSFHGPGGGRVVLKPDAALRLGLGAYEDRWFVEVDRGTESLSTVARKCELYRQYWQSGIEQARSGVFPRVLWLVPDAHRYDALVDVIGRLPAEAWPLFAVAPMGEATERLARGAGV